MRHKWVNSLLFVLVTAELVTGAVGLATGSAGKSFFLKAHLIGAFAILAIAGWKVALAVHSLRRPIRSRPRRAALLFAGLLIATLALGAYWSMGGYWRLAGTSGMTLHVLVGAAVAPFMAWHAWKYTRGLQTGYSADRRAALRLIGAAGIGALAWWVTESSARTLSLGSASRRFTGSYERGSFAGNGFPTTSWLNDGPAPVDARTWRLTVSGAVERPLQLDYAALDRDARLALPTSTVTATLDCTGGWYSTQRWAGVRLGDLLERAGVLEGARSVKAGSVTGYWRRFPIEDAREFLLATHVSGELLSHRHGAPVRLVAPGRRGYDWVKWVTSVTVETVPAWLQPPLPVQ